MGNLFLDQYSLLHYATGVMAYFWGIPPIPFFLAHVGFEAAENTESGMEFIKPKPDSFTNILGDNISALFGYYCAYKLDAVGKRRRWYV